MATVRMYSYPEVIAAKVGSGSGQFSSDSIFMTREPYLVGEVLSPSTIAAATSSVDTTPNETRIVKVQVDGADQVHYEVTPANQTLRIATTDSPIMSGDELFFAGPGYRFSFLEASV